MNQSLTWLDIISSDDFKSTYNQIKQSHVNQRKQQVQHYRDAADRLNQSTYSYRTLAGIPATPYFALDQTDNINTAIVQVDNADIISLIPNQSTNSPVNVKLIELWSILCQHCVSKPAEDVFQTSPELRNAFHVNQIESYLALSQLLSSHIKLIQGKTIAQFNAEFEAIERSPPDLINIPIKRERESAASPPPSASSQQDHGADDPSEAGDADAGPSSARKLNVSIHKVSPDLEKLVGGYRYLKRGSAIRLLWNYCKSHGLQSKENGKVIQCNDTLKDLFGDHETISFIQLLTLITPHLTPIPRTSPIYDDAAQEAEAAAEMLTVQYPNRSSRRATNKRKSTGMDADDNVTRRQTTKREAGDQPAGKRRAAPKESKRPTRPVTSSESEQEDAVDNEAGNDEDGDDTNEDSS